MLDFSYKKNLIAFPRGNDRNASCSSSWCWSLTSKDQSVTAAFHQSFSPSECCRTKALHRRHRQMAAQIAFCALASLEYQALWVVLVIHSVFFITLMKFLDGIQYRFCVLTEEWFVTCIVCLGNPDGRHAELPNPWFPPLKVWPIAFLQRRDG